MDETNVNKMLSKNETLLSNAVNYNASEDQAVSLTLKSKNFEAFYNLIINNAKFPKNFDELYLTSANDEFADKTYAYLQRVKELHGSVFNSIIFETLLATLRDEFPNSRYFYTTDNKSIAMTLIENLLFEMREDLNLEIAPHENFDDPVTKRGSKTIPLKIIKKIRAASKHQDVAALVQICMTNITLGLTNALNQIGLRIRSDYLNIDLSHALNGIMIITSDCPILPFKAIYQIDETLIFVHLGQMETQKDRIVRAFKARPKQMLTVLCPNGLDVHKFDDALSAVGIQQRVVFVTDPHFNEYDFVSECINIFDINLEWDSLDDASKERIKQTPVNFQGVIMRLYQIASDFPRIYEHVINEVGIDNEPRTPNVGSILKEKKGLIERSVVANQTTLNLRELVDNVEDKKFILITGRAGDGASTTLKKISNIVKEKNRESWVIVVNLRNQRNGFSFFRRQFNRASGDRRKLSAAVKRALSEKFLSFRSLECEMFKIFFEQGKLKLLLDGFDEILPKNQKTLLDMLKNIEDNQVFIASRPHFRNDFERELNVVSFELNPLTNEEKEKMASGINEESIPQLNEVQTPLELKLMMAANPQTKVESTFEIFDETFKHLHGSDDDWIKLALNEIFDTDFKIADSLLDERVITKDRSMRTIFINRQLAEFWVAKFLNLQLLTPDTHIDDCQSVSQLLFKSLSIKGLSEVRRFLNHILKDYAMDPESYDISFNTHFAEEIYKDENPSSVMRNLVEEDCVYLLDYVLFITHKDAATVRKMWMDSNSRSLLLQIVSSKNFETLYMLAGKLNKPILRALLYENGSNLIMAIAKKNLIFQDEIQSAKPAESSVASTQVEGNKTKDALKDFNSDIKSLDSQLPSTSRNIPTEVMDQQAPVNPSSIPLSLQEIITKFHELLSTKEYANALKVRDDENHSILYYILMNKRRYFAKFYFEEISRFLDRNDIKRLLNEEEILRLAAKDREMKEWRISCLKKGMQV